jgi:hypothetical protein
MQNWGNSKETGNRGRRRYDTSRQICLPYHSPSTNQNYDEYTKLN